MTETSLRQSSSGDTETLCTRTRRQVFQVEEVEKKRSQWELCEGTLGFGQFK